MDSDKILKNNLNEITDKFTNELGKVHAVHQCVKHSALNVEYAVKPYRNISLSFYIGYNGEYCHFAAYAEGKQQFRIKEDFPSLGNIDVSNTMNLLLEKALDQIR